MSFQKNFFCLKYSINRHWKGSWKISIASNIHSFTWFDFGTLPVSWGQTHLRRDRSDIFPHNTYSRHSWENRRLSPAMTMSEEKHGHQKIRERQHNQGSGFWSETAYQLLSEGKDSQGTCWYYHGEERILHWQPMAQACFLELPEALSIELAVFLCFGILMLDQHCQF